MVPQVLSVFPLVKHSQIIQKENLAILLAIKLLIA